MDLDPQIHAEVVWLHNSLVFLSFLASHLVHLWEGWLIVAAIPFIDKIPLFKNPSRPRYLAIHGAWFFFAGLMLWASYDSWNTQFVAANALRDSLAITEDSLQSLKVSLKAGPIPTVPYEDVSAIKFKASVEQVAVGYCCNSVDQVSGIAAKIKIKMDDNSSPSAVDEFTLAIPALGIKDSKAEQREYGSGIQNKKGQVIWPTTEGSIWQNSMFSAGNIRSDWFWFPFRRIRKDSVITAKRFEFSFLDVKGKKHVIAFTTDTIQYGFEDPGDE